MNHSMKTKLHSLKKYSHRNIFETDIPLVVFEIIRLIVIFNKPNIGQDLLLMLLYSHCYEDTFHILFPNVAYHLNFE